MGLIGYLKKMKNANKGAKLLVLGLDCSGKTTILKAVADEEISNIQPTQGFNIKSLKVEGVNLAIWDLGGQKVLREYWSNYFKGTNVLVYVIDAADIGRLEESGNELSNLLKEIELKNVPVLIFANKQDLVHAMEPDDITEKLKLDMIDDRDWMILACSATNNEGLKEGFEWAIRNMKK